jgi:Tfp pilus assembly protein PilO
MSAGLRSRVLAFGGALLVVSLLAFVLVLRPQAASVADARKQTETQRQRVAELRLRLRQLQALRQEAPQLRARAERVDTAMPNDPQLGRFVLEVHDAARKSAIDWLAVSPGSPQVGQQAGVEEISVSMNLAGGYFAVEDFVARLETLGRALKISQVTLGPGPAGLPQLSATLVMKMFVFASPAT